MEKNHRALSPADIIVFVMICVSIFFVALFLNKKPGFWRNKSYKIEIKTTITTLSQALKMYKADLNAFPPDGEGNLSTLFGGLDEKVTAFPEKNNQVRSAYCDGTLVRYLDGDNINDIGPPGIFIAQKPIAYFEFPKDSISLNTKPLHILDRIPLDDQHPCFIAGSGTRFFYNELLSENRSEKKLDKIDPDDPFYNFITFKSFQIFNRADDINDPHKWVTNYREP